MSSEAINADRDRLASGGQVQRFFDKFLFLIAFMLGAGGIFAAKSIGLGQLSATAWPVGVLLLYTFYVVKVARTRLREDQAGDNVYYLGFLFTLTSLAYALVLFSANSSNTEAIISNFGIALATTIVGLALRIFLNSMRQNPVEIEREARLELSDAASRLRSELDGVVLDFNSFRRSTQQSVAEGMEEISSLATEKLTAAVDQFSSVSNEMLETIQSAFTDFSDNSKQLNKTSQQTTRALAQLVERVEQIEAPADLIQKKLTPTLDSIHQVAERMNEREMSEGLRLQKLGASIDQWNDALSSGRETSEHIARQAEQMSSILGQFQSISEHFSAFESSITGVTKEISSQIPKQITGITTLVEDSCQRVQAATDAFEAIYEKQRAQVMDPANSIVTEGAEILNGFRALSVELNTATGQFSSTAKTQLDIFRSHNDELAVEVGRSRDATAKVQESLIEMINAIETNVRKRRELNTSNDL